MSFSLAAIAFYWRIELGTNNSLVVLPLFLLAGALMLLPALLYSSVRLPQNLTASLPIIAVISLCALVCAAGHFVLAQAAVYFALFGIWFSGIRMLATANIARRHYIAAIVLGLSLGTFYSFIMNTGNLANVFTPEAAVLGLAHVDTLFHSALAALFSRYGIVSTGLDGLVAFPYHALSHLLFGCIALWLNVPTTYIYAFASQIIGAPLLILSTCFAVFALWRPTEGSRAPLALLIFPLTFISIVEIKDWHSYLLSESYLFALSLFLLTIPLLQKLSQFQYVLESPTCLLGTIIATLVVTGTKVSVGFALALGVAINICMQVLPKRTFVCLVLAGFLSGCSFLLWLLLGDNSSNGLFGFWIFPKTYPLVAYLNMGVTALGIGFLGMRASIAIHQQRITTNLALIALALFLPTLALNGRAGGQYYFINIGVWIAAVAICGLFVLPSVNRMNHVTAMTFIAGAVFVIASAITPQKRESVNAFFELIAKIEDAAFKAAHPGQSSNRSVFVVSAAPDIVAKLRDVPKDIAGTYVDRLRRTISNQLSSGRERVALFIPPTDTEFWNLQKDCRARGFLFPALLGIPMINGVPSNCRETAYSFRSYSIKATNREMQDQELCQRAQQIGIDRVIKVISDKVVHTLDCLRK
ncbi:MAG: hypothetical protein J0H40_16945 [Rhizobiales bacterium]|nr:hypothetical protein [Hyphomicrobiales bacterium]